jgi:hypothetical protein
LGVLAIPAYPRLQVEDVALIPAFSPLFRPNLGAVIYVQITGRGTFHIDRVSVRLGDVAVLAGATTNNLILQGISQRLVVVGDCNYFGSHTTTLTVTIDGTWSPFANVQIPVSVSSTFPVQQSAWQT